MMAKIRFVASSLLDTLSSPSGDTGTGGINSDLPVRLQKAQSYLCKFNESHPLLSLFCRHPFRLGRRADAV
jgi:hypothetical protein